MRPIPPAGGADLAAVLAFPENKEMPMAKITITKKQYLRKLNRRLAKEAGVPGGAAFVFYPLGAKAKAATGVAAPAGTEPAVCAIMEAVQARLAAKHAVEGAIEGNGHATPLDHPESWSAAHGRQAGEHEAGG